MKYILLMVLCYSGISYAGSNDDLATLSQAIKSKYSESISEITVNNLDLSAFNLRDMNLSGITFKNCNFYAVDFCNADLTNSTFISCNLQQAAFNNAKMDGVLIDTCVVIACYLTQMLADVGGITLSNCDTSKTFFHQKTAHRIQIN
jgi:uncharacterized protein YjbI with pentapeptide repeats